MGGGAAAMAAAAAAAAAVSATATAATTTAPPPSSFSPSADNNVAALAYELVQGNIVRFLPEAQQRAAPTAVLVHGILGNRRNLASFAHMLVEAFPSWQVLLVDLRCHGESAYSSGGGTPRNGPHSVATAARDVLALLRTQKLFPHMLIGHSFGGKVVMSMAQQFADACNPNHSSGSGSSTSSMSSVDQATTTTTLPRPVQVWVLDTLPGEVRLGDVSGSPRAARPDPHQHAATTPAIVDDLDAMLEASSSNSSGSTTSPEASAEAQALLQQQRRDHPADLIQALRLLPTPVPSRNDVLEHLTRAGFSAPVSRWMTTNLRPAVPGGSASRDLAWTFDVEGLADMYLSYEAADLWPLLETPPQGLRVDFVRAEGSTFRWAGPDRERLEALGHRVHVLVRSGHWVHTDNPQGLIELMAETFHAQVDLRVRRSPPPSPSP
jgi:pimeloyl-ACP methyl ester carboxylesterase